MKKFGLVLLLLAAALGVSPQAPTKPAEKAAKPAITREALEARLVELERGRAQAVANVNAYDGAIQECNYWLGQLKAAEEARKAPPPSKAPTKKEPPAKEPEAKKP